MARRAGHQGLVSSLGHERFVLVGHDWGAATAWTFALHYPDLLDALVILATPHPATFDRALHDDPEQQRPASTCSACAAPRSSRCSPRRLRRAARDARPSVPQTTRTRATTSRAGAGPARSPGSCAGIGARASVRPRMALRRAETTRRRSHRSRCTVPTLVIYPTADVYTRPAAHRGLEQYVPTSHSPSRAPRTGSPSNTRSSSTATSATSWDVRERADRARHMIVGHTELRRPS